MLIEIKSNIIFAISLKTAQDLSEGRPLSASMSFSRLYWAFPEIFPLLRITIFRSHTPWNSVAFPTTLLPLPAWNSTPFFLAPPGIPRKSVTVNYDLPGIFQF